jgi:hypothetical protein
MHQAMSILTIVLAVALPAFDLAVVRPHRTALRAGLERTVYLAFCVTLALLVLSSILPLAVGSHMRGWLLILHMTAAPVFAVAVALLALLWADRSSVVLWVIFAASFTSIVSALFCMMTWFGSDWQRCLLDTHRVASMVLLIAAAVQAARAWLATRGAAAGGGHVASGARD